MDEEHFEAIREHFETWARTPLEIKTWTKYKALADAYYDLYAFAKDHDIRLPGTFQSLFGAAFKPAYSKVEPAAGFISR